MSADVPPATITFKVTGNGSTASTITYSEDTSIEQATGAQIPWSEEVDANANFYQVSAQDSDGTSITCEIIDGDGNVLDERTSTGEYAIAACSAHGQ